MDVSESGNEKQTRAMDVDVIRLFVGPCKEDIELLFFSTFECYAYQGSLVANDGTWTLHSSLLWMTLLVYWNG